MIDHRRTAPATQRNRDPILGVLRRILPPTGLVLEIASGTGEHVAHFAAALPGLRWQPSDPDPIARPSIEAWTAGTENILAPLLLDASAETWPVERVEAIICINMVHISPWTATAGLMRGAAAILRPGAPLYLYGPYRRKGGHTAPSNASFDADLRARNPEWGVRDVEAVMEGGWAKRAGAGRRGGDAGEQPVGDLSTLDQTPQLADFERLWSTGRPDPAPPTDGGRTE
jgi:Protein of unknown function (DUF938)